MNVMLKMELSKALRKLCVRYGFHNTQSSNE